MAKSKNRQALDARKTAKRADMKAGKKPTGESLYARKRRYLDKFGGSGDSYPAPKPWGSR